jgi:hypothetical protein
VPLVSGVGPGIASGRRHCPDGGFPVGRRSPSAKPFYWFSVPGGAAYLFEVVFAGEPRAIVWGAMAERAKLWVYSAGICSR